MNNLSTLAQRAIDRYGINTDDYYISNDQYGDKVILNRRGIDKVSKKIHLTFRIDSIATVPYGDKVCVTLVATGKSGDLQEQTVVCVHPDNCTHPNYAEVAFKRAKHRLLLSMADLYEHGIFSDVESDKWTETRSKYGDAVASVEKALSTGNSLGAKKLKKPESLT